MRADTGVGPSIASGNQVCKPICADLPTAANKNEHPAKVNNQEKSISKKLVFIKTNGKFKVPVKTITRHAPIKKLISPTRLTTIAFKAALLACKRVYQKLINK